MSHAALQTVPSTPRDPALPFRTVDRYLDREIVGRALAYAFRRGLIDRLLPGPAALATLSAECGVPADRLAVLADILASGAILDRSPGVVALAAPFREVLPFRDLLEARLVFTERVAEDLMGLFPAFIEDMDTFLARSRTFELFRYDRCLDVTPENLALTRRWVDYTTCLTRYEAGAALDRLDLAGHARMLDLGGNSGEFAAQACARSPRLMATVVDLPVVCALGRDILAGRPEAARVSFQAADLRGDVIPPGHDLVTFKSVLHDWPAPDAASLLGRAAAALTAGGSLVVFERAPMRLDGRPVTYASVADLVFQPFFREADLYREVLAREGLRIVADEAVDLGTPFHFLHARKLPARRPA